VNMGSWVITRQPIVTLLMHLLMLPVSVGHATLVGSQLAVPPFAWAQVDQTEVGIYRLTSHTS
jgi:hypothetical protein